VLPIEYRQHELMYVLMVAVCGSLMLAWVLSW
jgi:hypothetical protein